MLTPANQSHLHPLGRVDYTASFFTQMLLTNALGYRQRRYADREAMLTIGDGGGVEVFTALYLPISALQAT